MSNDGKKLSFASDYMEGAHPAVMKRLMETNLLKTPGYGTDDFSESAREKIRRACQVPEADVFFLVGGTQANATVIDAILSSYQGVVAADSGHISLHEAGAIETGGHKVLTLPGHCGKIKAEELKEMLAVYWADENREHMVMPGMVYISQPTEYGTLYSLEELSAISKICREYKIPLYLDGARMAYGLACPDNDVFLPDIARLCDAFYIGGTKCGALFGEAVVFPQKDYIPHIFSIIKQHGALLAKGRIAGIQFDTLFDGDLYRRMGKNAIIMADRIRKTLQEKQYEMVFGSPTNQIFIKLSEEDYQKLSSSVEMSFWEKTEDGRIIVRLATSWATTEDETERLCKLISGLNKE